LLYTDVTIASNSTQGIVTERKDNRVAWFGLDHGGFQNVGLQVLKLGQFQVNFPDLLGLRGFFWDME
jgi:hypothetical protein